MSQPVSLSAGLSSGTSSSTCRLRLTRPVSSGCSLGPRHLLGLGSRWAEAQGLELGTDGSLESLAEADCHPVALWLLAQGRAKFCF